MRAFSLLELMVVVAMAGVMAAVAVPNMINGVRRADGERATLQIAVGITAARDAARTRGACVDFVQEPAAPKPGPYLMRIVEVPCPPAAGAAVLISEVRLPAVLELLAMRPLRGVEAGSPIATVHFDVDGAITNPFEMVEVATRAGDIDRAFTVFPVAGLSMAGQRQ